MIEVGAEPAHLIATFCITGPTGDHTF
jgi:hypothetical protein